MATCYFCKTSFISRQAVRAHLKACPAYQAHLAANVPDGVPRGNGPQGTPPIGNLPSRQSSEPKARVSKSSDHQITIPEHGSRLKEDEVETVLCLHEALRGQRQRLVDTLPIRRLMATVRQWEGSPSYEDWYELAKEVLHLELATDRIVTRARVSRDEPWSLHKLALSVRERWLSWRREEASRMYEQELKAAERARTKLEPDRLDEILADFKVPELEASWSRILDWLRWLTTHTKARL